MPCLDTYGPDIPCIGVMNTESKTLKGQKQLQHAFRCRDPRLCLIGTMSVRMMQRCYETGEFKKLDLNSPEQWYHKRLFATDQSKQDFEQKPISYNTEYNAFKVTPAYIAQSFLIFGFFSLFLFIFQSSPL